MCLQVQYSPAKLFCVPCFSLLNHMNEIIGKNKRHSLPFNAKFRLEISKNVPKVNVEELKNKWDLTSLVFLVRFQTESKISAVLDPQALHLSPSLFGQATRPFELMFLTSIGLLYSIITLMFNYKHVVEKMSLSKDKYIQIMNTKKIKHVLLILKLNFKKSNSSIYGTISM